MERASKCQDCPRLPAQYAHVDRVRRLEAKQERLKHMLSNEALTLFPDFQQRLGGTACLAKMTHDSQSASVKGDQLLEVITRIRTNFLLIADFGYGPISPGVLQELGYINEDKVVQLKGKQRRLQHLHT